jgi:hypothetical protein
MLAMLQFHRLFRSVSAQSVEYSFAAADDVVTTMIPLTADLLPAVSRFAAELRFAGQWAWSVERFARAVDPNAYLFRVDWYQARPKALTLYCRFHTEPQGDEFSRAMMHADPFSWDGPSSDRVGAALDTPGPRGIAFRVSEKGTLRCALYYRSDAHAGRALSERLPELLDACSYPAELAGVIESCLRPLYQPGPIGVVGIDNGTNGTAGALKFDPANVPLTAGFLCLAQIGVAERRLAELKRVAIGLRARSATYLGIQFSGEGVSGWRFYLGCEPGKVQVPGGAALVTQQTLRPARRLPHY